MKINFSKLKIVDVLLLLLFNSACSTVIRPEVYQSETAVDKVFAHQQYDKVLKEFVNEDGRVNYSKLKKERVELDQYYAVIATYSPDSHPELFPTKSHELAYWINAYNAATITTVLRYYPIDSLSDVEPPSLAFFFPELSGFFFFQKQVFGGKEMNLYSLENSLIRERYKEPRIHFALNCASIGCPRLPRYAFEGDKLEEQLEYETKKFFSEQRNFSIDRKNKLIKLSPILDWFSEDFGDIREYLKSYVSLEQKRYLDDLAYQLHYVDYDWGLNSQ